MKRNFTVIDKNRLISMAMIRERWMRDMLRITLTMFLGILPISVQSDDTQQAIKSELSKPEVRGGLVFKNYCALCHGERADGLARTSILHGSINLRIALDKSDKYENIIRKGGEAVGMSPFMPPWENELSDEQISDVVTYLKVVNDSVSRGHIVFKTNCILCHGINGDGKGRAAKLFHPAPADLTISDKNDDYKEAIIRLGGAAMGRSPVMPVWGEQLSEQEIKDVVSYLRTILVSK